MWLGHWYHEVAVDLQKARNCYNEALLLDAKDAAAAEALAKINEQLSQQQKPPAGCSQIQPSAFTAQSKQAFLKELSPGNSSTS